METIKKHNTTGACKANLLSWGKAEEMKRSDPSVSYSTILSEMSIEFPVLIANLTHTNREVRELAKKRVRELVKLGQTTHDEKAGI